MEDKWDSFGWEPCNAVRPWKYPTGDTFDWLEFHPRPESDGLHDSGYRFISVVGVTVNEDGELTKTQLHEWADHVVLAGVTNIDVQSDGTIRLMPNFSRSGWKVQSGWGWFGSDAMFVAADLDSAIRQLQTEKQMRVSDE